jgi:hypothetical protein
MTSISSHCSFRDAAGGATGVPMTCSGGSGITTTGGGVYPSAAFGSPVLGLIAGTTSGCRTIAPCAATHGAVSDALAQAVVAWCAHRKN